jgi:DNA-binding NtrC family response regulator
VQIPSLRERKEDVPLLVRHFLEKFRPDPDAQPPTVSQEAMRRLMAYPWPGNVRQLENAIERAMAFTGGRSHIDAGDLPAEIQHAEAPPLSTAVELPDEGINLEALIASIERDLIARSLERTGGNKGQAAKLLNLKRTTLVEKIKRLERL